MLCCKFLNYVIFIKVLGIYFFCDFYIFFDLCCCYSKDVGVWIVFSFIYIF